MRNIHFSFFQKFFGIVSLFLLFVLPSTGPCQFTPLYQKDGPVAGSLLGWSVAGAGDVDGDGVSDFIVGAPHAGGYPIWSGSAYVYSGSSGALLYQKNGSPGDELGRTVAGVGNVNGDGRADFIVGAPFASPGGHLWAGTAYIFSGLDGSVLFEKTGTDSFDMVGLSVAGTGDVNGDGRVDFIVSSNVGGLDTATVFVYSGVDGTVLYQISEWGDIGYGTSVAGAGDVNGDGKADFMVGAHWATIGDSVEAGTTFIYSGADAVLLYRKDGQRYNAEMGYSVACAGDVNGDGKNDLIMGAPYYPGEPPIQGYRGKAYVFSGPTGALIYELNNPDLHDGLFGWSVAGVGDVDGDGRDDFAVGIPSWDSVLGEIRDVGSVMVYSGATGSVLGKLDGPGPNKEFGYSVAGCGDVNGDGRDDVIIGAAWADPGGFTDAGSAYIYSLPCAPVMVADVNQDSSRSLADVIMLVNYIFKSQPLPGGTNPCAADLNSDADIRLGDLILLINHLFKSQALPYENCGC